jgi:hypothetical protein
MKTQSLAAFVWNTWKGKPASSRGHFVPATTSRKAVSISTSHHSAKKTDTEPSKPKRTHVKLSAADRRELISSTQHLDSCFSSMWRKAV